VSVASDSLRTPGVIYIRAPGPGWGVLKILKPRGAEWATVADRECKVGYSRGSSTPAQLSDVLMAHIPCLPPTKIRSSSSLSIACRQLLSPFPLNVVEWIRLEGKYQAYALVVLLGCEDARPCCYLPIC
jgi:hypothetical protein